MVLRRRIVCCKSCRKRFVTTKGSTLCMTCRPEQPEEVAPELTYGGDSLSVSQSSKRRDAKSCTSDAPDVPTDQKAIDGGSAAQSVGRGEKRKQCEISSDEGAEGRPYLPKVDQHTDQSAAASEEYKVDGERNLSLHCQRSAVDHEKNGTIHFRDADQVEASILAAPSASAPAATHLDDHPVSKKRKVEREVSSSDCFDGSAPSAHPTSEGTAAESICELDCKDRLDRRPKVSLGSMTNGGCSSESEDELDAMIAQGSIWRNRKKSEEPRNEMHRVLGEKEDEDDDSDIECLGTSSESQLMDEGLRSDEHHWGSGNFCDDDRNESMQATESLGSLFDASDDDGDLHPSNDMDMANVEDGGGSTALEGDDRCDGGPDEVQTDPKSMPPDSPKKDVCYICGSDLSKLTSGLKGRVAHMKRCSAKYGKVLGGRSAMDNDGDFDADFVGAGAAATAQSSDTASKQVSGVANPYDKNQWHGDVGSELELNKASKQTKLKQFFKQPVRSLTNVLMAGARQVAKGKAIVASKDATSGKQSYRRGHWSSRRSGNCPGYKRIPGTDFICDGFHYARKTLSENYFLTHFHSDHYGGITKTWNEGTIYCSLPTANLVHQQLGVDKRYLHPIPMNTPTVIASKDKPITVTLLDANHCPGAIMFLFQVGNRTILHVGDFRWHRELMLKMPQLRAFSNSSPRLDEIFLDTTYCNKKYSLPTQEEAINAAIEVAEREMAISKKDTKMKTLFLFGSYTIGKERIYLSVAERLKLKVYVDSRRFRILSALEWPKERMRMFTTNKTETSLWVVPLSSINFKQMRDYLDEGNKSKAFTAPYGRVVGFRPTGWTYSAKDKRQRTLPGGRPPPGRGLISSKTSGRYSVHGVPYSEHSSFPELVDCLRCLKPKKITPTVSVSKSEEQVELLLSEI